MENKTTLNQQHNTITSLFAKKNHKADAGNRPAKTGQQLNRNS